MFGLSPDTADVLFTPRVCERAPTPQKPSGGTESNNLVLRQPTWDFVITDRDSFFPAAAPTEHHSVHVTAQYIAPGDRLAYLPVDRVGSLADPDQGRALIPSRCSATC